ncbi:TetR/AcrR family transcriptional regulator [Bacterioplanoides sp.]|uniref:TetR/AcrR family transcriptional regulator n=1 Tax=Bacterioplanoides sp. TaxID=2066072 RepID=UPI003AFFD506
MSRPSLKEQRYQQVMDAYEACVARYGLEGATLERIAEKADLARPLIRHNVGNRRELQAGLMQRFEQRCHDFIAYLNHSLTPQSSDDDLIRVLFERNCDTARLAYSLSALAEDNQQVAVLLENWKTMLRECLIGYFVQRDSQVNEEAANAVAVGICAIYSNAQIYQMMKMQGLEEQSSQAALRLLRSLQSR